MKRACYLCCTTDDELRPYGPRGEDICFDCMTATPEREEAAKRAFIAQFSAAAAAGDGIVAIGEDVGPRPLVPTEREE